MCVICFIFTLIAQHMALKIPQLQQIFESINNLDHISLNSINHSWPMQTARFIG